MLLGRREAEPSAPPKPSNPSEPAARGGTPCGSLARVLARVFREPKAEILSLGPLCGESVVYLATRGARVHAEDFEPPPCTPPRQPGEVPVEKVPIRFDHPYGKFHLVLAWELTDFVPPERLADYGEELLRVTRDGGWLFLFSHARPLSSSEPLTRYRLLADDRVVREVCDLPRHHRWVHPNREIERALTGFSVQGIQLQRTQMREILALKVGVGS